MLRDTLLARLREMEGEPDYSRLASEVLGIRGAPAVLARRLVAQALVVEDRRESWRRAGAAICEKAPTTPGVYVLRDNRGSPLYVGKARNLRRRLRAHFADRRWRVIKPAMSRIEQADWEETGSELEALIREATLIRDLQPSLNVQVGPPSVETRQTPSRLVRDVILILPSIEPDSVELIATRVDGPVMIQRANRCDPDLGLRSEQLWQFFHAAIGDHLQALLAPLAPLVFSWLAGRGADTTRLDPHDAASASELQRRLQMLLEDAQLFAERIVLTRRMV